MKEYSLGFLLEERVNWKGQIGLDLSKGWVTSGFLVMECLKEMVMVGNKRFG